MQVAWVWAYVTMSLVLQVAWVLAYITSSWVLQVAWVLAYVTASNEAHLNRLVHLGIIGPLVERLAAAVGQVRQPPDG